MSQILSELDMDDSHSCGLPHKALSRWSETFARWRCSTCTLIVQDWKCSHKIPAWTHSDIHGSSCGTSTKAIWHGVDAVPSRRGSAVSTRSSETDSPSCGGCWGDFTCCTCLQWATGAGSGSAKFEHPWCNAFRQKPSWQHRPDKGADTGPRRSFCIAVKTFATHRNSLSNILEDISNLLSGTNSICDWTDYHVFLHLAKIEWYYIATITRSAWCCAVFGHFVFKFSRIKLVPVSKLPVLCLTQPGFQEVDYSFWDTVNVRPLKLCSIKWPRAGSVKLVFQW